MASIALCPICGFELNFEPWYGENKALGSFGICHSCSTEFGFHDDEMACGKPGSREELWIKRREEWVAEGMPWRGSLKFKPKDWDPIAQLKRLLEKEAKES